MLQWYTAELVTMPMSAGDTHFQNTTCSGIWWLFIFVLSSMLKIWRWSWVVPATEALRASTLATGFISAESAVIGRRSVWLGFAVSTMTTCP